MHSAKAPGNTFQGAVSEMLELWKANDWFVRSYWPENRPRVERMLRDLQRTFPKGRIFEPGCGNGYISFLAARLGYEVWPAIPGSRPIERNYLRLAAYNASLPT